MSAFLSLLMMAVVSCQQVPAQQPAQEPQVEPAIVQPNPPSGRQVGDPAPALGASPGSTLSVGDPGGSAARPCPTTDAEWAALRANEPQRYLLCRAQQSDGPQ